MGTDNIISAVMHADELNTALTEEYGKPIYHYHLHVVALPVVRKEVKWTKKCKDKSLIGTTKEIINQVSHSKKWKSEQLTDNFGNPVYDENGKAKLIKSYSLLQDRFFQYMSDSGYRGFIRGIKGSTKEHLTDLEFKIKKESEKLEKITNNVAEKQSNFDNFMQYDKKVEDISNFGKQKKFSKKIELEPKDYETLTQYAKKGIVADKEIYERDTRIENLRNTVNRWIEKYEGLVEKTKDYFHAIKLAPQKVTNFFKSLFDKEKQDALEKQKLEQAKKRIIEIDNLFMHIYEDNVSGKITDERFRSLFFNYDKEQQELKIKIEQLSKDIENTEKKDTDITQFISNVKKYTEIAKLTPEILNELIEKIVIHQKEKVNGKKVQDIDIYYRGVGIISFPVSIDDIEVTINKILNRKTA